MEPVFKTACLRVQCGTAVVSEKRIFIFMLMDRVNIQRFVQYWYVLMTKLFVITFWEPFSPGFDMGILAT